MAGPATRRLARRPLVALVAEGFLSRLSFGIVSFALPLFALHLGLNLTEIGLLLSFNLIVAVICKPLMGWVADEVGLKRAFVAAIALRSVVSLLLIVATAPWQLFAVRGLHGVSIALRDPAANALLATAGGGQAVASSFAWYQTAKTVAGNAGRAAAGLLITATGSQFPAVFAVAFVLSVLPLVLAVRHIVDTPPADAPASPPLTPSSRSGVSSLTMHCMSLGFVVAGTAYLMANLFPIMATEYAGLSAAATGSIYALGAALSLSGPLWGWLADHVSLRLVLSARSVGNIGSSLLWLISPTYGGLAGGKALDDAGKAAFRPAWGALMAQVAALEPRRRARVMGYASMGEDAGEAAGPIVAGSIWSMFGLPAVLALRIVLAVGAEIYAVRISHRLDVASSPAGPAWGPPRPAAWGPPNVTSPHSQKPRIHPDERSHHRVGT